MSGNRSLQQQSKLKAGEAFCTPVHASFEAANEAAELWLVCTFPRKYLVSD
jgi:hypothetical protein